MSKPTNEDLRTPDALPRGILTTGDREFLDNLTDEQEINSQAKRDTRYRIRERIIVSLTDFLYLGYDLPDDDVNQIFERLLDNSVLSQVCISAFTFFYRGLSSLGDRTMEQFLETAIRKYEINRHPDEITRVNVRIDIVHEPAEIDEVLDRIVRGQGTWADFVFLAQQEGGLELLYERLEETDGPLEVESSWSEEPRQITQKLLQHLMGGPPPSEDDESGE